jgi:NADH-quinone oxidoreductase subunit J
MSALFFILSLLTIVACLAVVLARNPLYSALWLITAMLSLAAFYAMLNAHFLAVVQVIVYAGAIMVLVIFVLMLLNLKSEKGNPSLLIPIVGTGIVSAAFVGLALPAITRAFGGFTTPAMLVEGDTKSFGVLLFSKYVFAFEAASILILAAIVGAVMLAKRSYKETRSGAH